MPRVLYIDDDEAATVLLSHLLGPTWEVVQVHTIEDAGSHVHDATVQVILLDLHLGVTRGMTSLRALMELTPAAPVVVYSGAGSVADGTHQEAALLGADSFVRKSSALSSAEMTAVLESAIARHDYALRADPAREQMTRVLATVVAIAQLVDEYGRQTLTRLEPPPTPPAMASLPLVPAATADDVDPEALTVLASTSDAPTDADAEIGERWGVRVRGFMAALPVSLKIGVPVFLLLGLGVAAGTIPWSDVQPWLAHWLAPPEVVDVPLAPLDDGTE